jgi:peptidoglycan/LPS O-acetylase OafA/YrhL
MDNRIYFSKLDSLRFIAFFLVIWQHAFSPSFSKLTDNYIFQEIIKKLTFTGGIGVHIFFVISGFLITFLMIKEEENVGRIKVKHFYIRRFLRIWPLYYIVMLLGIFILPLFFGTFTFNASMVKNLIFLNNFDKIGIQIPNIGIAWSVAIEEQFYICWPIIFTLIKDKRLLIAFSLIGFILSTIFVITNPSQAYFHTFANVRFLMIGCVGAILYSNNRVQLNGLFYNRYLNTNSTLILIVFFIVLSPFSAIIIFLSQFILPVLYLIIVINMVAQGQAKRISFISRMGKYTYGMYLYHPLIIIFTKIGFDSIKIDYIGNSYGNFLMASLSFILTIVVSFISYEYLEKKILRYKSNFAIINTRI